MSDSKKLGRPFNSGKWGEATVVTRIPKSWKPTLDKQLEEYSKSANQELGIENILGAIRPKFVGLKRPLSGYKIPAGFPSPADGYTEGELSFDELFDMKNPSVFLYWVSGHSLEGAGIFDGNLVVLNRSLTPRNGEPIMARVNGKDTFKLYYRNKDSTITLKASNDKIEYPDIHVKEGVEFEFMGVITDTVKTFRKRR